jgi:hypothetical protein
MSNSLTNRGPACRRPAGRGDQGEDRRVVQVVVGQGAAGQELDADALPRAVVHHRRPDPGLRRGHAVAVLGVAVDPSSSEPGPGCGRRPWPSGW